MCTGAYMLKSWTPGVGVAAVRNPHHWHPSVHPLVGQITIKGVPSVTAYTSGMLTGAIQGGSASRCHTSASSRTRDTVRSDPGPGG